MKKILLSAVFCLALFGGVGMQESLAFSEGEKQFLEELKNTPEIDLPEGFGDKCDDFYEEKKSSVYL